jgi:predicted O-methyltransferase YrrM
MNPMTVDVSAAEAIRGWMTSTELRWLAQAAAGRSRVVEVGCWLGRSTKAISTYAHGVVFAVDHWKGSAGVPSSEEVARRGSDAVFGEFCGNLRREIDAGRVVPVRVESAKAVEIVRGRVPGGRVDMVFIDANHEYASVVQDIRLWRPLVAPGGLFAGHDYAPQWPGVVRAVDEQVPGRKLPGDSIWCVDIPPA